MLAHRRGCLQFVIRLAVQDMLSHPVRGLQFGIRTAVQDMLIFLIGVHFLVVGSSTGGLAYACSSEGVSTVCYSPGGPGHAFPSG